MRNPFVAATMKAQAMASLARTAALMCFNFGLRPADYKGEAGSISVIRHSGRTVAQDKRDARKARNRARNKR